MGLATMVAIFLSTGKLLVNVWIGESNVFSFRHDVFSIFGGMMSQGAELVSRIER